MIQVKIDIDKWKVQFIKDTAKTLKQAEACVNVAARALYTRMVNYTPVGDPSIWHWPVKAGYKPGTLKVSWLFTEEGSNYTISNNQPYATRVEYGWSSQAPNGMMRRAVLEYPKLLNDTTVKFKL